MASLLEHLDAQLAPLILSTEAALATVDAQSAATTRACTAADALLEGFLTRVRADEA